MINPAGVGVQGFIRAQGKANAGDRFCLRMLPRLIEFLSVLVTRAALSFRVVSVSALAALVTSGAVTSGNIPAVNNFPVAGSDLEKAIHSAYHNALNHVETAAETRE